MLCFQTPSQKCAHTVPSLAQVTNLKLSDPVVQYLAPSYDMLLVIISQVWDLRTAKGPGSMLVPCPCANNDGL